MNPEADLKKELEEKAARLIQQISQEKETSLWDSDKEYLQDLLECLIRIYAHKVLNRENGIDADSEEIAPVFAKFGLNQTETSIFVDKLLLKMDVELFEVQMWRSLGSNI